MKINITIENNDGELVFSKIVETEERSVDEFSPYARFFNESCPGWLNDSECNLMFLKSQQQYANELLRSRGHLFLNEVYDLLGLPRTKAGQVVGWIYDPVNPVGDNYIDFDVYTDRNEEFINGYAKSALLDFNVDGNILDKIVED